MKKIAIIAKHVNYFRELEKTALNTPLGMEDVKAQILTVIDIAKKSSEKILNGIVDETLPSRKLYDDELVVLMYLATGKDYYINPNEVSREAFNLLQEFSPNEELNNNKMMAYSLTPFYSGATITEVEITLSDGMSVVKIFSINKDGKVTEKSLGVIKNEDVVGVFFNKFENSNPS